MIAQLLAKSPAVDAAAVQFIGHVQAGPHIPVEYGRPHAVNTAAVHDSQDIQNVFVAQTVPAKRQELFQEALSVPHASIRFPRHRVEHPVRKLRLFLVGDIAQMPDKERDGDAPEIKALAATQYGGGDLVGLRRC
jgi:hypothetical protein